MDYKEQVSQRKKRAKAIAKAGDIEAALKTGAIPQYADVTLSEAIVLGLMRQGVRKFLGIFGHGATEIAEVLRVYEAEGLVKTYNVRHETAASHAATSLRWVTGEKAAVFTSIGPGALHALAGSLTTASDGIGVWYLLGDETIQDEGPNMQQIPKDEQHPFLRLYQTMGQAYCLHTPGSVSTALRRGLNTVDHPFRAGPFYLLMPMNTQCSLLENFNIDELPVGSPPKLGPAADNGAYAAAAKAILDAEKVVVRIGGGCRQAGPELEELLELADGAGVLSPLIPGVIAYDNPRNMTVGGSKGSLSGNYAMEEADMLVAVGSRFVCQSDCSRTAYPKVKQVVNINGDVEAAMHYNKTIALIGDVAATLRVLNEELKKQGAKAGTDSAWFKECKGKKAEWEAFKKIRYDNPVLFDEGWGREVLTQPSAIKTAVDWARAINAVTFFDAGDVQANGFQIVEDEKLGRTFSDTGASYMGFSVSSVFATAMASKPFYAVAFSGDGSFTMNPQILIDGTQHGAQGCLLIFDNRSMAAIGGLQNAQYGSEFAISDQVEVDYVAWANSIKGVAGFHAGYCPEELKQALDKAHKHKGISLIHVPVYNGADELGGMGVFGRWNVGNWCENVQALRHKIGL